MFSGSSAMLRKRGKRVRQDRSVIRHATQMLSHSASPIPDKTYAKQCCTSTFESFSSPQMSSCGYWRTARSDVQTTTRGHLDRIDGNSVRPMKRPAASADAVLVASGMPGTCQRRKRRRSSASQWVTEYPLEIENRVLSVLRLNVGTKAAGPEPEVNHSSITVETCESKPAFKC